MHSIMSRILRHAVLLLASVLTAGVFYLSVHSRAPLFWVSMATAYSSLVLLALSLGIGPWNRLRGQPNPVSSFLRRDIGIWAGLLGIVHVIFGLQVHLEGKFWLYFLPPADAPYRFPLRIDTFGLTNYAGLFATVILLLLLSLSSNVALRTLGAARWKSLQRWNYAGALLIVVHGVIYQFLESRTTGFVIAFGAITLLALTMQLAGFIYVRRLETARGRGR